jgi:hypothetical protein
MNNDSNKATAQAEESSAANDVGDFIADLDAGQIDTFLSVALTKTAAAVVAKEEPGSVTLKLDFLPVDGTRQVRIKGLVTFKVPTATGDYTENSKSESVMFVGLRGKLSATQADLFGKGRQSAISG